MSRKLTLAGLVFSLIASALAAQESAERAREIFKAGAAATGGDAVSRVKSVEMKGTGTVQTPMGPFDMEVHFRVTFPERMRVDSYLTVGDVTNGFNGKNGWVVGPQGSMEMPAERNPEYLRGIALVGGVGVFQQVLEGKARGQFTGEAEFNGKKSLALDWESPAGKVKLYFDAETKLLIGAQYRVTTPQGALDEERRWSDFKAVEGLQFPTRLQTYRDGALYTDITLKEIKLNPSLDEKLFQMP
jgi:outer membrane lipoprotein-sorting protein